MQKGLKASLLKQLALRFGALPEAVVRKNLETTRGPLITYLLRP
jgi:hypothetical protein